MSGLATVGVAGCSTGAEQEPDPTAEQDDVTSTLASPAPLCLSLHVHASFSEGAGSMEAQLDQAREAGVDMVWWTEHDWRMSADGYCQGIGFEGDIEDCLGHEWRWEPRAGTPKGESSHHYQSTPVSTTDARGSRSLMIRSTSSGQQTRYELVGHSQRRLYQTSLAGQTWSIDVRIEQVTGNCYLAFEVLTSYRPAHAGREAGQYLLSYRVGDAYESGSRRSTGRTGIVGMPAAADRWTTWEISPADDLAAIWPQIEGRDASSFEVALVASSDGASSASGSIDGLRIQREAVDGDTPLRVQQSLIDGYASAFPDVAQAQGLEVSAATPHIVWYGADVSLLALEGEHGRRSGDTQAALAIVATIHSHGGIASYAHPFGTSGKVRPDAEQPALRQEVAERVVAEGGLDCDLMEVGYRARGGGDLASHMYVWDACTRAGLAMTAVGVNDNHSGIGWTGPESGFLTYAWSDDRATTGVLRALGDGRVYVADATRFRGSLDLVTPSGVRMGATTEGGAVEHVTLLARALPPDCIVRQVVIALASDGGLPSASDYTRAELPGSAVSDGRVDLTVDTSQGCLLRVEIIDHDGQVVAFTNPIVWTRPDDAEP